MNPPAGRRGATIADGLVFLATVSLFAALLYPAWSAREFRARVSSAAADVDALTAAARVVFTRSGEWPTATAPGEAPPELAGFATEGGLFSRIDYRLGWTTWHVVDSVEAPPILEPRPVDPPAVASPTFVPIVRSVGGVAVYTSEAPLLAELSQRYAAGTSIVLDTMWLLVLPERGVVGGAPTPPDPR